jgi:tetratricopeptide (TPR) repeat protein
LHYAENHQDTGGQDPENQDAIWAEYSYSGDISLIDRYIRVLERPDIEDEVIFSIKDDLTRKSRIYYPVFLHLSKIVESEKKGLGGNLFAIHKLVNDQSYKPSNDLYFLAKNHMNTGDYEQAMTTLRSSFTLYPDNPYLFFLLGHVLVKKGDLDDAISAYKKANWLFPGHNDKAVNYYLAEAYDKLGDLEQTIYHYQQAIDIDPEYDYAIARLTAVLLRFGDHEKTVKYARQLIQKSKNVDNIVWAREVLEDLQADVSIADQKLMAVRNDPKNLLKAEQFQEIEKQLAEAYKSKSVDENGDYKIYSLYAQFIPESREKDWAFEQLLPKFSNWVTQYPDSHFANTSAGIFYLNYAWHARGSGYASSITPKGRGLFHERMRIAGEYFTKAYEQDANESSAPCNMITVAKINPAYSGNKNFKEWYNLAVQANPNDPAPHWSMFGYLAPKWGGSYEEQFELARSVFRRAPKNSSAPVILSNVHWQIYQENNDPDYFKNKEVWEELKAVYSELIRRFPESIIFHNRYARTAYLAGDQEIAKREFEVIGDNWDREVWGTQEDFDKVRKSLKSKIMSSSI